MFMHSQKMNCFVQQYSLQEEGILVFCQLMSTQDSEEMSHAYLFILLFAKSHNDSSSECAPQVHFLHTYSVVCCTCMFVISQKLFEVVVGTVRTHSVKTDVYTATVCIPTAAGLQDCARLVGSSLSVDTSLLAGDKKRP